MNRKLVNALTQQKNVTKQRVPRIYGVLGLPIGGTKVVEVANRNSYVYVRLRNNQSEVIQAFNNQVAPAYNLPVIVERQGNRYTVVEVDSQRYENNWTSFAPFLPRHGNTHSFDTESGGGGDVVFVHAKQFMPSLIFPSGSLGGPNVLMAPYILKNDNGTWKYTGNTGTASLLPHKPNNSSGTVLILVYLDSVSGNPSLLIGSGTFVPVGLTGTSQIVPYIPTVTNPSTQIPLSVVRLVSGTTQITWDNIYDVRQFIHGVPSGTGGSSSSTGTSVTIWDEGVSKGTVTTLNFVGTNVDASVSGTVARIFVTGTSGSAFTGLSGSVALLDSNGLLTSQAGLKWGLQGGNVYLEYGANVVKEGNAGKMGYQLFDSMFDIVGAGLPGNDRWINLIDNAHAGLFHGDNMQIPTLTNVLLATNATGSFASGEPTMNSGTYGRKDGSWTEVIPTDGWIFCQEVWTRTGNYTFTVSGDVASKYRKGTKVKYSDPSIEYGVVATSVHSAGTTTVTLITNNDYAMAAATITDKYISYIENPSAWPDLFNFTISGLTGSGSMLPFLTTTTYAKWKARAKTISVEVQYTVSLSGTASTQINIDTPVDAVDSNSYPFVCAVVNGTAVGNTGLGAANGGTDKLLARTSDASNWVLGAGRIVQLNGEYPY